jgi:hypothetical protein
MKWTNSSDGFQRAKRSREERIAANTVMRVAIRSLFATFTAKACEASNDAEELFEAFPEPRSNYDSSREEKASCAG